MRNELKIFVLLATVAVATETQSINTKPPASLQLTNSTIPSHYNISLRTEKHEAGAGFYGTVQISLDVVNRTDSITVHSRRLTVESAVLYRVDGDRLVEVERPSSSVDEENNFLCFTFSTFLENGSYVLKIEYRGTYPESFMQKLYPEGVLNGQQIVSSSEFEATQAREAFPCYDVPATISISITQHENDVN